MLRFSLPLLGRWNSRDFLKGRSKLSGAVHTRSVFGNRGRYKRWSALYTLRDGHRHVNNHFKRGLGIKLGGGLFGLRIPRQAALSTMTRAEYELELYGHPNITNPYRDCLQAHPSLQAVMANASLSVHLVVLLPRIARSKRHASSLHDSNNNNNINSCSSSTETKLNAVEHKFELLEPLWRHIMNETITSVKTLLSYNRSENHHHDNTDNNNNNKVYNNVKVEICFSTLERSVNITVMHQVNEEAIASALEELLQEHRKGRILHTSTLRKRQVNLPREVLIKERLRAMPLFGNKLRTPQHGVSTSTRATLFNNEHQQYLERESKQEEKFKRVENIGVERVIQSLRTSLPHALCACVLMSNCININSVVNDTKSNKNNNNSFVERDVVDKSKELYFSSSSSSSSLPLLRTNVLERQEEEEEWEQKELEMQNRRERKAPLVFAFASPLHHMDHAWQEMREEETIEHQKNNRNNKSINCISNINKLKGKKASAVGPLTLTQNVKTIIAQSSIHKNENDTMNSTQAENSNQLSEHIAENNRTERRLLKDEIDEDELHGVWALPKSSLHKLLSWHYCNDDPRAHNADALPHHKRQMHLLLFVDASKCSEKMINNNKVYSGYNRSTTTTTTTTTTTNNNNNTKRYITKSLLSHYFIEELKRMGFKPVQSSSLYFTTLQLVRWIQEQEHQQEMLEQFAHSHQISPSPSSLTTITTTLPSNNQR